MVALVIALLSFAGGCDRGSVAPGTSFTARSARDVGEHLVDRYGRAVYAFSGDSPGQSGCLTACAVMWPPVSAPRLPESGSAAVDSTKFRLIIRPDSARQVTYNGIPLYYFDGDQAPGDIKGHNAVGYGGRFALVSPRGAAIPPP